MQIAQQMRNARNIAVSKLIENFIEKRSDVVTTARGPFI